MAAKFDITYAKIRFSIHFTKDLLNKVMLFDSQSIGRVCKILLWHSYEVEVHETSLFHKRNMY